MNKNLLIFILTIFVAADGLNAAEAIDGYWLFRAPVDSANSLIGMSFARRYGPNQGNGRDIGVLWRPDTPDDEGNLLGNEERHCGAWTQFFFDDPNISLPDTIKSVYFHAWIYMEETTLPIGEVFGLSVDENYNSHSYYDLRQFEQSLANPRIANFHNLVVYHNDNVQYPFDNSTQLWGISFKATGGFPQVLSYPNQKSFCLVNLADSATLLIEDSDSDGINDYSELFETFTDPYDSDTDDDGRSDKFESENGKNGWDPCDWGTTYIYYPDGQCNLGFVRMLNNQSEEPEVSDYWSLLDRELTSDEYDRLSNYDEIVNDYEYSSLPTDPWSLTQLNFQFTISQPPEDISIINFFLGGIWISHINGDTLNSIKALELINLTGGESKFMPAKHGKTHAFYIAQIREQIDDFISEEGKMYFRAYTKNRLSSASVQLDFVELRVTAGNSLLNLQSPTSALPIEVQIENTVGLTFTIIEQDVELISGVSIDSLLIGDVYCSTITSLLYENNCWTLDCIVPVLPLDSLYDLHIVVHTNSGLQLSASQENSVHYIIPVLCGDINNDGAANDIIDLTYLVDYIFREGPPPVIPESADLNGDSLSANVLDLTDLVDYIFRGGPVPC